MTEPDSSRRRPTVPILIAAGVVVAIALVLWWARSGSEAPVVTTTQAAPASTTTSAAPPDSRPRPPQIEDSLPLPDGAHAYDATWDGRHLWALAASEPVSGGDIPDEATLYGFDPATGEVLVEVSLGDGPSHLGGDADGVWVVLSHGPEVVHLDAVDGSVITSTDLPDGSAAVDWLAVALGTALVGTEDGEVLRIGAADGTVTPVTELSPTEWGEVITDQGEVWILSASGEPTATLVDPLLASSQEVPFDAIEHDVTLGGFALGEMALGTTMAEGSVVTVVDRSSLEPVETVEVPGMVVRLGWVAGSFGTLDEDGVFQRLRPTDFGMGRFETSWDRQAPLFPVDEELWMLAAEGTSLDRVLLTANAD